VAAEAGAEALEAALGSCAAVVGFSGGSQSLVVSAEVACKTGTAPVSAAVG
jgi:PP-loop superfamily ATP-utilizing enzyme